MKKGDKFICKLDGGRCAGKVQEDYGGFFLCQDQHGGNNCSDKLGYRYSWCVGGGTKGKLEINNITDFEIIDTEDIRGIQVGDIVYNNLVSRKVLDCSKNEIVWMLSSNIYFDYACDWFTIQQLQANGYKIEVPKQEDEIVTVEIEYKKAKELGLIKENKGE